MLTIRDLRKSYPAPGGGPAQAVIDVPSFEMQAGAEVCLAGRSGSGKTTFLNLIAGIQRADAGSIELCGSDLVQLGESARDAFRARHIGYVFQTFNLLDAYSALENVLLGMLFGPGPDRGFAKQLLGELGLGDRLGHKPHQLSIGQRQRVALARALANKPKLVLADEPTGSLDPARATEALELMRRACAEHGASLLLVSHDESVIGSFDRSLDLSEINRAASDHADVGGGGAA